MASSVDTSQTSTKKANPAPGLKMGSYDFVASMLIALLVLIGVGVLCLAAVWLSLSFSVTQKAIPVILDNVGGGREDGVLGESLEIESPDPEQIAKETDLTEPQIQEVLGLPESGHDYFLQITDARPDTGGLSGATPQEAMTWGKVDPDQLPDTVTCYLDSTVALPLLTAYALAAHPPRKPRRLMERLEEMTARLEKEYRARRRKDRAAGL